MIIFVIILICLSIALIYLSVIFKFGHVECVSNVCLNGKVALVTGGSSGIGYQLALQLASRGCKVIIADKLIGDHVKKSIVDETDNPNVSVEYVDFSSFKSVRSFAEKLKISEEKLDILINNVGIGKAPEKPSEDGFNMTLQINHFSPFLLTHLLVDLLKKSRAGRIVFTTSSASFLHVMTPDCVAGDDIQLSKYRMNDYSCAKFCTVVASDMFARKLRKFNINCNCYHPGIVRTTFFQNTLENIDYFSFSDWWAYAHIVFLRIFVGVTPRKASQAALNLAVSKKYENVTGTFFGKYFPNYKPKGADDKNFCGKIWNVSEKIVKLRPEEKL